ncbi:MAG: ABC transporter permease [Porphyromonadaceae bacterium]|nr:MAG: ABC transporter permease [Porphyromonadaceae bacterium]
MMVVVPLASSWFFFDLMHEGAVERVPVGIVDLDNTSLSRTLTRNLSAFKTVDVKYHFRNYQEATDAVQRGLVLGFFYIPSDLSEKALSGNKPTVSYYINYAYYTPASTMFKGFKTISVMANGAIVSTALQTLGVPGPTISATLQPVLTDVHALNNPWTNYSYYLNNSFVPCFFALIIFALSRHSALAPNSNTALCRQWLQEAGDSIIVAITGKNPASNRDFHGYGVVYSTDDVPHLRFSAELCAIAHALGYVPLCACQPRLGTVCDVRGA